MATDKPTVQYSIAKLRKEVKKVEPFQVALSNSKIVTFPNLYEVESEEAEAIMRRVRRSAFNWDLLKEWLDEDDIAALKEEKLTHGEMNQLVRVASKYYEDHYGDSGEDTASAS